MATGWERRSESAGGAEEVRADRDAESARLGTHCERGPADAERDTEMMRMERPLDAGFYKIYLILPIPWEMQKLLEML